MGAPLRLNRLRVAVAAALIAALATLGALAPSAARAQEPSALSILLTELEGLLGRPLDGAERTRCLDAGRRAVSALREQDLVFMHSVAGLLGLSPEMLRDLSTGAIDPPLAETLLGRPLSPAERARLDELRSSHDLAVAPVRGAYARDIASATGLPPPTVLPLLPRTGI
ncbi:hypothetical protein [Arenibaculum pallidiluteum]|uniref:hypothetical protein n=1 Tax=Arenibaculum pallidiluteum TaxID=2812559 RepID=UPI001A96A588|nr:hypothetical protein [Arenibaculum pallidiluteum]